MSWEDAVMARKQSQPPPRKTPKELGAEIRALLQPLTEQPPSSSHSSTFAARVGAAGESLRCSFLVVFDGQAMRVAQSSHLHIMPECRQFLTHVFRHAFVNGGDVRFDEAQAWSGNRLLHVHLEIDHVHHHLRNGLHNRMRSEEHTSELQSRGLI